MKEIRFRKNINQTKRLKNFCISQAIEDKRSLTKVRKSFIYLVRVVDQVESLEEPQIYIKKCIDNEKMTESFRFRVKGFFYLTQDRQLVEVRFCHTLKIEIAWKEKYFSPQKSVVLTK